MGKTFDSNYFDSMKDVVLSILKEFPANQNDVNYIASVARRIYGVYLSYEEVAFFAGLLVSEGKASLDVSYYRKSGGYLLFQYEEQPPRLVNEPPTYEEELDRVVLSFLRLYPGEDFTAGDIASSIVVGGYGPPPIEETLSALSRLIEAGNVFGSFGLPKSCGLYKAI